MSKPHLFPNASKFGQRDALTFVAREKILELYNQANDKPASNYSDKVQLWFAQECTNHGWMAALPVRNVDKLTMYSGCILFNGLIAEPAGNKILLRLQSEDEDAAK